MISRVTSQTMTRTTQQNLQTGLSELARLRERAVTGNAIGRPSEDPSGTKAALSVRAELRANEQHSRNINNGDAWLTTVDAAMSTTTDLLNRVKDLALRGANDSTLSPAGREGLAAELESLGAELLKQANTTHQGRAVFAGNSDTGKAFDGSFAYAGVSGSGVERRMTANSTVRVDADGAAVFGQGPDSVFALVNTMVTDLRAGTGTSSHLAAIDSRTEAVLGQHAAVGARHAELLRAREANVSKSVELETQRSGIEDLDLSEVVMDMKLQEIAYQNALAVSARVLQPTLMDFLR
ncbi:flagellar hook-associated protein 3 [Arthrobacter roseus]|uniref:flagellin N-terminal helical domain-containing protein n=1 Tax=Arthrobacter roseus TaxID=136274 RepID=UPI0019648756|nr:flagellar hook-associated protein 3 [Arthrobacter roseus]MBM7847648.1 flagellar hook-associated protein 3 FlgL [Arthrobacter roseus]